MPISASNFTVLGGATDQEIADLNAALIYLQQDPLATDILRAMVAKGVRIVFNNGGDFYANVPGQAGYQPGYIPNSIYWNPNVTSTVYSDLPNAPGTGVAIGVISAALALIHEGAHATDPNLSAHLNPNTQTYGFTNAAEQYAVNTENIVATFLGEPVRPSYNGRVTSESNPTNPTEHTIANTNSWQEQALDGQVTITGGTYTPSSPPAPPASPQPVPTLATFSGINSAGTAGNITASNDVISIATGNSDTITGNSDSVYEANGTNSIITITGSSTDKLYFGTTSNLQPVSGATSASTTSPDGNTLTWINGNVQYIYSKTNGTLTIINGSAASGSQPGNGQPNEFVINGFNLQAAMGATGFDGIKLPQQLALVPNVGSDPLLAGSTPANGSITASGDEQTFAVYTSVPSTTAQTVAISGATGLIVNTGSDTFTASGSFNLTIPAGQDSVTFGVAESDPTQSQSATLTASLGGSGTGSAVQSNSEAVNFNATQAPPSNSPSVTILTPWQDDVIFFRAPVDPSAPASAPKGIGGIEYTGGSTTVQGYVNGGWAPGLLPIFYNINTLPAFLASQAPPGDTPSLLYFPVGSSPNGTSTNVVQNALINLNEGSNATNSASTNDILNACGDLGNDTVIGTAGSNDYIFEGNGNNLIELQGPQGGQGGQDVIMVGDGNNQIYSSGQTNFATALTGAHVGVATGQPGSIITTGNGNNIIAGDLGNDAIYTGTGNNVIVGGPGSDTIFGGIAVTGILGNLTQEASNYVLLPSNNIVATSAPFAAPANYQGATLGGTAVGTGNDTIYGGTGNSFFYLPNGNNYVDAGGGNDYIQASTGSSTIFGGSGNDTIFGGGGNDYIDAESGNDVIYGQGGNSTIFGGSGNDTIASGDLGGEATSEPQSASYLDAGSGNTALFGAGGNDTLMGGGGNDYLCAGAGNQYLEAGSGATNLVGGTGNDTLVGGSGGDYISAGTGNETITGGSGSSIIIGSTGNEVINAGSGNANITAGSGNATITGGGGLDAIYGGSGNDVITMGDGLNGVYAGTGNTTITGGSGAYNITVGGTDTIVAGSGTGIITGGGGTATYQIGSNSGGATINSSSAGDTLQFGPGVTIANTTVTVTTPLSGTGTAYAFTLASGAIIIVNPGGLTQATFGDGTTATFAQLVAPQFTVNNTTYASVSTTLAPVEPNSQETMQRISTAATSMDAAQAAIAGTLMKDGVQIRNFQSAPPSSQQFLILTGSADISGTGNNVDDVISANSGNDTLIAGTANDTLNGGGASDDYVVSAATGTVTTINGSSGADTLSFATGISLADLSVSTATASDGSLIVTLQNSQGGSVVITSDTSGDILDQISFADGSSASLGALLAPLTTGATTATSATNVTLAAGIQNMTLTGNANITATGNAQADVITANSGNDTLIAGTGSDTLVGSSGATTYQVNAGSNVTIASSSSADTLAFGTGINENDLTTTSTNGVTTIVDDQGGTITIQGGTLSQVSFANGDTATLAQLLAPSYTVSTTTFSAANATAGAGIVALTMTGSASVTATANALNDTLTSNSGNDTLIAGSGNDTLNGGFGATTYAIGTGSGMTTIDQSGYADVLSFGTGIAASDLSASAMLAGDGSITVTIQDSLGNAVVINDYSPGMVDQINFADGTSGSLSAILAQATTGITAGTSAADVTLAEGIQNMILTGTGNLTATGNDEDNIITANSGNDTLIAGTASDTLIGGAGATTYEINAGGGNVTITGSGTADALLFGTGIGESDLTTSSSVVDGVNLVTIADDQGGTVTIQGGGLNQVNFGDGSTATLAQLLAPAYTIGTSTYSTISATANTGIVALTMTGNADVSATGNSLNDIVTGNSGNDTLISGTGVDTLVGGIGNDLFIINNANDVVSDPFGSGNDTEQTAYSATLAEGVQNLVLTGIGNLTGTGNDDDDVITANSGNDTLVAGTGVATLIGGSGNDTFVINSTSDVITATANTGNNTEQTSVSTTLAANVQNLVGIGSAALTLTGNAQNDVITANGGSDTLVAGSGNDTLNGGGGTATYEFNVGDGNVVIANSGSADTLAFGAGISASDLTASNSIVGGVGVVTLTDSQGGSVTVQGGGLNNVSFADGSTTTLSALPYTSSVSVVLPENVTNLTLTGSANLTATANALNDVITANSGNDTLIAGTGNDTLSGGGGTATYQFNLYDIGNSKSTIVNSGSADTLDFGAGTIESDLITSSAVVNGVNDVFIQDAAANSTVTIQGGDLNNVLFADGSSATLSQLLAPSYTKGTTTYSTVSTTAGTGITTLNMTGNGAVTATANSLNDLIQANGGGDTLIAGRGNDTLVGAGQSSTNFVVGTGSGVTTINDYGLFNTLSFGTGISAADLSATAAIAPDGAEVVTIQDTQGNSVVIDGSNNARYGEIYWPAIDQINFADGSAASLGSLLAQATTGSTAASSAASLTLPEGIQNMTLTGTGNLTVVGNDFADVITANNGNDTLIAGSNNDTLVAGNGDDFFQIGPLKNVTSTNTFVVGKQGWSVIYDVGTLGNGDLQVGGEELGQERSKHIAQSYLPAVTVEFDANVNENQLQYSWGSFIDDTGTLRQTLNIGWGDDSGVRVVLANPGDENGSNNEQFQFADGVTMSLSQMIALAPPQPATFDTGLTLTAPLTDQTVDAQNLAQTPFSYVIPQHTFLDDGTVDNVTYAVTMPDGSALPSWLTFNATTNTLSSTGAPATDSTFAVEVTATDASGLTANTSFNITVANAGLDTSITSATSIVMPDGALNLTLTGSANISGTGNNLANVITGNSGNDTLIAGSGLATLIGGTGNDTFVVNKASDVVQAGAGNNTVQTTVSYTAASDVQTLVDVGSGGIVLTGNGSATALVSSSGIDTLVGASGNDTFVVNNTGDVVQALAGTNVIQSSVSYTAAANVQTLTGTGTTAITLTGNALNDVITGNTGADTLISGTGIDTLTGGSGNDTFEVNNVSDVVQAIAGVNAIQSSVSYTAAANVQTLTGTGSAAITLIGNAGSDTLVAGSGLATLVGGSGNDTFIVNNANDVITEATNTGNNVEQTSVSTTLAANVESLTGTGTASLTLTGNSQAGTINANSGADTLVAGSGLVTLIGGSGNDTFVINNVSDVITEAANTGSNTEQSSVSTTLAANLQNLIGTGAAALTLTGGTTADMITANSGNDTLIAGTGVATLVGGSGNDTFILNNANDNVVAQAGSNNTEEGTFNLAAAANVQTLIGLGTGNIGILANNLNDVMTGNAGNDELIGGTGNDTMIAGAGIDSLLGGSGNDTFVLNNASDVILRAPGGNDNTEEVSFNATLAGGMQNLSGIGSTAIKLTGNTLADVITANSANDTLVAGSGLATLVGGSGNDTFVINNASDVITEAANSGSNTEQTALSATLAANVQNLTGTGSAAITLTGNAIANKITANTGADTLIAGSGNDTLDSGTGVDSLVGGAGDDTFVISNAADVINEAANSGNNTEQTSVTTTLAANVQNLTGTGSAAITLTGNSLNNVITANTGADTLVGGSGNDTFVISSTSDVISEAANSGTNTENSSVTTTLAANVQNLMGTGSAAITLTGNSLNNVITGNSGTDTLVAGSGNDTLTAGSGKATLTGGAGSDVFNVNNVSDVVTAASGSNLNVINSSVTFTAAANVTDLFGTGSANITLTGNSGNDLLVGNTGTDTLTAGTGIDVLEAGTGTSTSALKDTGGSGALIGGAGNDTLTGGSGANFIVGGTGNDAISLGAGAGVVAFNTGDGKATIAAAVGAADVLSLGDGIAYSNLSFSKSGNNLILNTGGNNAITFTNWYSGTANQDFVTLQVLEQAASTYSAASSNVLYNSDVEEFSFTQLVAAFNAALAATPTLSSWSLSNSLLTAHLSGSNTAALGGDLAYYDGLNGNLTGLNLATAVSTLQSSTYGKTAQTIDAWSGISTSSNKLH